MSSRRITSFLRDRTISALIEHRFSAERKEQEQRSCEIGQRIYNDTFSVSERELMQSLPDGWLPVSSHIRASIGGIYESICMGGDLRFPSSKENQCVQVYDGQDPIAIAWVQLEGDKDCLRRRVKEARAAALAILESVTTTGALIAKWPEVAPFLPPESLPETLPSIPIESINKLLGLEPTDLAAAS
jgi:hypothetical protein